MKKIAIKPNMCYYWDYSTGYTTDPRFVGALIEVIREKSPDAEISIVEADASAMKCDHAFNILGYEKIAKQYNVNLVNLANDKTEKVDVDVNGIKFSFLLPETLRLADLKINVPKPKYMNQTKITCGLKNIFGCNPEPAKYKLHKTLDEAIVGLNKVMKFDLAILDGGIVVGRSTRKLDLVMASQDVVAFDSAVAKLMGENPNGIRHIKVAEQAGLGQIKFVAKGTDLEEFKRLFPKTKRSSKFLLSGYKVALKTGLIKSDLL